MKTHGIIVLIFLVSTLIFTGIAQLGGEFVMGKVGNDPFPIGLCFGFIVTLFSLPIVVVARRGK